ncbi:hypothetical protein AC1031_002795 [Aphanomyces cochlioides]|nr:hypothetical protein AC1031_002795 [Aphanomyces cochlioides]
MLDQVTAVSSPNPWWREPTINFLAGSISGFCAKFVEFPLDTVKVQLQTQSTRNGAFSAFGHIAGLVQREGPAVLYRGLPMPLFGTVVETACLFATFGQVKNLLYGTKTESLATSQIATAGGVSGCIVSFILTPIELIKCRMQVTTKALYKNTGDCIVQSYRREGLGVFFKGLVPTMWREIPGTAAWFSTYHVSVKYLQGDKETKSELDVVAAGALSGIAYNGAFYPADTVKSHVQTHPSHRRSLDVVREIYSLHGIKGFYRGLVPTVIRAIPANAVLFYTYEEVQAFFHHALQ